MRSTSHIESITQSRSLVHGRRELEVTSTSRGVIFGVAGTAEIKGRKVDATKMGSRRIVESAEKREEGIDKRSSHNDLQYGELPRNQE